jgi:glycyl-tRNA synthetase alpha subunit
MDKRSIADKLHRIENVISGAINSPEIVGKLNIYGYTIERIVKGKQLLDNVNYLMTVQVKEYGSQYAATDAQEKFLTSTYAKYMVTVKVSRVAFKKRPDILASLGVIGGRPRSLPKWLRSSRILYINLMEIPDALEIIAMYGYTIERLQQELQDVEEVENLHIKQLSGKSAAQQATQKRNEVFDELCDWYSDFRAIARIALYDDPQLLEALGIVKK